MTTTTERPAVVCPSWCPNGPCRVDEHFSDKVYIGLTGGRPLAVDGFLGTRYPALGVGLTFSRCDGDDAPLVTLHLTGPDELDQDLDLRAAEARALIKALQDALALLDA